MIRGLPITVGFNGKPGPAHDAAALERGRSRPRRCPCAPSSTRSGSIGYPRVHPACPWDRCRRVALPEVGRRDRGRADRGRGARHLAQRAQVGATEGDVVPWARQNSEYQIHAGVLAAARRDRHRVARNVETGRAIRSSIETALDEGRRRVERCGDPGEAGALVGREGVLIQVPDLRLDRLRFTIDDRKADVVPVVAFGGRGIPS